MFFFCWNPLFRGFYNGIATAGPPASHGSSPSRDGLMWCWSGYNGPYDYDGPRQGLALACGDLRAEDLSACQVRHAKEKEEILKRDERDVVVRRLGDWHFPPYFGRRIQHSVPFHVFNRLGHCMDRPGQDGYPGRAASAARESLLAW